METKVTLDEQAPPRKVERRRYPRFAPKECGLRLEPVSTLDPCGGQPARRIMNLGQGGLCALVLQRLKVGDLVRGHLSLGPAGLEFVFTAQVRHVQGSARVRDRRLVGIEFLDPSVGLRACIRKEGDLAPLRAGYVLAFKGSCRVARTPRVTSREYPS